MTLRGKPTISIVFLRCPVLSVDVALSDRLFSLTKRISHFFSACLLSSRCFLERAMLEQELLRLPSDYLEFEKQPLRDGSSLEGSVVTAATGNESFASFLSDSANEFESCAKTQLQKDVRRVSFDSVEVRHYERILEFNPACSKGAAIGIGWEVQKQIKTSIDEWEKIRTPRRRARNDLILSSDDREDLLLDIGYTTFEVAASARDIWLAQTYRLRSILNFERDQRHRRWKKNGSSFLRKMMKQERRTDKDQGMM